MEQGETVERGEKYLHRILYTEKPDLGISGYDSSHVYEVEFLHTGSRIPPAGQVNNVDCSPLYSFTVDHVFWVELAVEAVEFKKPGVTLIRRLCRLCLKEIRLLR